MTSWLNLRKRPHTPTGTDDVDLDIFIARTRPSTATVLVSALCVFVTGVLFVLAAGHVSNFETTVEYLRSHSFLTFIFGHFGIALVVAAIAGAVYEVYAHHKHLQEELFILAGINQTLAERQLDIVLGRLMRPNDDSDKKVNQDLLNHIRMTVLAVAEITKRRIPAGTVSLRFVDRLLRYAGETAHALAQARLEGRGHEIELPATAAALADEILADELRAMRDGDSYRVVTDFATWRSDQLPSFLGALTEILKTDKVAITVERVFCVFDQDLTLSSDEALDILQNHWRLAHDTQNKHKVHYNVGVSLRKPHEHVGIFSHSNLTTCFNPTGSGDLAKFTISLNRSSSEFERHWEGATKALTPGENGGYTLVESTILATLKFKSGKALFDAFRGDYRESQPAPASTPRPGGEGDAPIYD